ncbi:hypothetical protein GN244_ATG04405 [Phytophthora infestans]|uniref:Integrase catalytic domain-containing protein n=1 Tax=Phytophthora infestans TaxID=4787 RepID=A0A833T028_PHYIN|nr:hypothetical protein GN244_ATG04405 [Phytophthora infestans]
MRLNNVDARDTRYTRCYLLRKKSAATDKLEKLILRLNTQFQRAGHKVVTLYSDQSGKFQKNNLLSFCKANLHERMISPYIDFERCFTQRISQTCYRERHPVMW